MVKNAIVVDANEIKRILAEKYQVSEANVIKSQYSYTIIVDGNKIENSKCTDEQERETWDGKSS